MASFCRKFTFLIMACTLLSCSGNDTVRLGFIGGLTGRNGDLGTAGRDGAQLAVDSLNAAGGINGRKVELVVRDDTSNPLQAQSVMAELIKTGVVAVIGPMTSAVAETVVPISTAARVVLVAPTVSSAEFNGRDDYFFHLNLNRDTALATADYLSNTLKAVRPAVIMDSSNRSYTATVAGGFKERFLAAAGRQVSEFSFNSKEKPDLLKLARSVAAARPDGIFLIAGALDSAMLCQQLKKIGSQAPVFIAEWGGTNEFIKAGGSSVAGVRGFQHFNADSSHAAFTTFKSDFMRRFGDTPSFAATYSYEAVMIVAQALKAGGQARIKESIIKIGRFTGLQGDVSLDAFGDPRRSFSLMQVSDGRFRLVN